MPVASPALMGQGSGFEGVTYPMHHVRLSAALERMCQARPREASSRVCIRFGVQGVDLKVWGGTVRARGAKQGTDDDAANPKFCAKPINPTNQRPFDTDMLHFSSTNSICFRSSRLRRTASTGLAGSFIRTYRYSVWGLGLRVYVCMYWCLGFRGGNFKIQVLMIRGSPSCYLGGGAHLAVSRIR